MEFFLISSLNGLSYGLLLFMLSSGLTLIFSMMGVLNFAHASFYMLGAAMAKAKSTDPVKVAAALDGLRVDSFNGEVEMRKLDHQLQQPLYMTVWQKADKKYPYSPENTGMTLVPLKEYPNYVSSTPTSCQMKRPS